MANVYETAASFYDALSGERFVYRAGREAGVTLLGLRRGDTVLDLGCGTGLNLALLVDAVGPSGTVIALDRSPAMLRMARNRVESNRWSTVRLFEADATTFAPAQVASELPTGERHVDAVFSSYAMSVFHDWHPAWDRMCELLRPGGRAGIVDMQLPTGIHRVFSPLARLAAAVGGADLDARPWTVIEREGVDVRSMSLSGGHIRAVAATIP
ncbi:class I SAM-dependent methyltransferase [Cryobacterium psychrophilum]|uniref:Methyltransferase domain-containing protein n=1 Tax=Cryobacterium psychrophilum TaxID=41988 RepID=A0A4Y8KWM1_9MICO|nr:methyltransferase domain-containing protein [Cryobacterium psychrophilum]TDW28727.1 demethylmenaquinone methyltransferase/2-methoxy-6-polyprenyl-1,4-benzoquinol methylase [Cryobacterium psychrophilum]TFD82385.1 methyltransferase domain-containing protein [Cryobacterium psychrophilum]